MKFEKRFHARKKVTMNTLHVSTQKLSLSFKKESIKKNKNKFVDGMT
jgi:hypothetical protein